MNLHVFERVTTRVGLAAIAGIAGVGATVGTASSEHAEIEPAQVLLILGGFLVAFMGALALAFIRWLRGLGQNVPRDPARVGTQLQRITEQLDKLTESTADLNGRLSRLEGQLDQLVVVVPERRDA